MSTKIDRINAAYSQLRISGLTVNPSPEDISVALNRLEDMMAELEDNRNLFFNYNFEETPDPASVTNVKRSFNQMIATNLAIRLIPDFNKDPSPALIAQATQSLSSASGVLAANRMREVQYPDRQPRGSGNARRNRWTRFYPSEVRAKNIPSTNYMQLNDVNDFVESFSAYLDSGETISSFTITGSDGVTVQSSANSDPNINYRVKAITDNSWETVTIVITTSSTRIETRIINFQIGAVAT